MLLHLVVWSTLGIFLSFLELVEHLFVALLLILDVSLVLHRRAQVHHIFADYCLHLERVEVLLVEEHVF